MFIRWKAREMAQWRKYLMNCGRTCRTIPPVCGPACSMLWKCYKEQSWTVWLGSSMVLKVESLSKVFSDVVHLREKWSERSKAVGKCSLPRRGVVEAESSSSNSRGGGEHCLICNRRRQWHPTPVLLPGKSHGQRSLVGCSPWGHEESDTTERLHFYFSLSCIGEGGGSPLQCSCLENPRDRGAWWAAVHWVTQSWTRLKWLSSSRVPCHYNRLALPRSPYRLYIKILPILVAWLPGLVLSWILALFVKHYLQVHVVLHHRLEAHTGINLRSHSRSPQQTVILPSHLTWSFDSLRYSNPWQLASLYQNAHWKVNPKCWAQGAQDKCDAHASFTAMQVLPDLALPSFFSHHSLLYILGSNTSQCGRSLQKPCYSLAPDPCSCCQLEILSLSPLSVQFSSVQLLSYVWLFATPWIAARQTSLSITNSWSSLKLTSIESVMPSSHLILCCPLFLLSPIPLSIRVFSNESTLCMRSPKYWSFSFSIIPGSPL